MVALRARFDCSCARPHRTAAQHPPCRLYHCYCYLAIAFLRWIGLTCTSLPPCVPQTPRFAEAGRAFLNFALTTFCVVRADCLAWCRHHHHRRRHRLRCFCFRFRFLLFDTHASPSLSCVPPHPPPPPPTVPSLVTTLWRRCLTPRGRRSQCRRLQRLPRNSKKAYQSNKDGCHWFNQPDFDRALQVGMYIDKHGDRLRGLRAGRTVLPEHEIFRAAVSLKFIFKGPNARTVRA